MPKQMSMAGMIGQHIGQSAMAAGLMGTGQQQHQNVEFQEKQRYCGEQVALEKPQLNELRQEVARMNPDQINKLQGAVLDRKSKYFEQPEVQALQKTVQKLKNELMEQVEENCQEKTQLAGIWNEYDNKFAMHQQLEQQNMQLRQAT